MTEREAWIAFSCFSQIGPARFGLLRNYFGSAKQAWQVSAGELVEIGFSQKLAGDFEKFKKSFSLEKYLEDLAKGDVAVIILEDKEYPKRLKEIEDAPYLLYVRKGKNCAKNLDELSAISIAVVGTRKMTSYGREVAERLVGGLVASGVSIVSGMALGIDAMAHRTCLDCGGFTIGVLGNGLDQIYPPANSQLGEKIIKTGQGALISEYPLGYPAMPQNFPSRNRIVSGVAMGVLVVEGAEKSGTLLTASNAAAQGREVFAVPGPITSATSKAPNYLIRNGAKLVEQASEILEELNVKAEAVKHKARQQLPETEDEKMLFLLLSVEGLEVDSLVRISGMETGQVLSALTTMELKGMVRNVGGIYIKIQ